MNRTWCVNEDLIEACMTKQCKRALPTECTGSSKKHIVEFY